METEDWAATFFIIALVFAIIIVLLGVSLDDTAAELRASQDRVLVLEARQTQIIEILGDSK